MSGRSDVLMLIDVGRNQQLVDRQVLLGELRGHAERRRPGRNGAPDPATADDAELFAAQLRAEHEVDRPALPRAAPDQPLSFADPPRRGQDQRPGQLRGGLGEHVRRIGDDHAALRRRWNVDVVVADGDVCDDLQVRRRVEQRLVDAIGQHADQPGLAANLLA